MASKVKVIHKNLNLKTAEETSKCSCSSGCYESKIPDFNEAIFKADFSIGSINTSVGSIPQVSTKLSFVDILGELKVRFGIGRMSYSVKRRTLLRRATR